MTCDFCGHPESSHAPSPGVIFQPARGPQRACSCEQCPDFVPFQGYFGPPPTIEQESA